MLYDLIARMIERNNYKDAEEMQFKLDVFFAGSRLTLDEYNKLTQLLKDKEASKKPVGIPMTDLTPAKESIPMTNLEPPKEVVPEVE